MKKPVRIERCSVDLIVDKQINIDSIPEWFPCYENGDIINISYRFNIKYFDNTVVSLKFIIELIEKYPEFIKHIDLTELNNKTILLQKLILQIENIKALKHP